MNAQMAAKLEKQKLGEDDLGTDTTEFSLKDLIKNE